MNTITSKRIAKFISQLDWPLLKGSAIITTGIIVARGIGFVVSSLQARYFEPADFGIIQYAISLAGILAIGIQPVGQHVIARYIGKGMNDPDELRITMSNIWALMAVIFCTSLVLGTLILSATGKFHIGILVIFIGTSSFYTYWGLARGYLASSRLIMADVGNNLVQAILLVGLVGVLGIKSSTLAMLIQGLSCFVPLILLQSFWPLDITFSRNLISTSVIQDIFKFSVPIWVSHASFILYMNVALIFVEHQIGIEAVGIFSLASTLSIMFSFIPSGLSTFLMPRIASTERSLHRGLLMNALGMAMLANIFLLIVYYFTAPWLIEKLFGPEYYTTPLLFLLMPIVMTLGGVHGVITSVFVGRGRAQEETKSRLLTVAVTVMGCWLFIPIYGVIGAAEAMLIGISSGLALYAIIYLKGRINREKV